MKYVAPAMLALLAACTSGAPGPTSFTMDERDKTFHPPAPSDNRAWVGAVLKREELTLEDCLKLADVLSPELNVLRKDIDIAAAEAWGAGLYPNPSLVADVEEFKTGGTLNESRRTIGVQVPVVYSGRVGAATRTAQKEREAAACRYLWERRRALIEVKKAFIEVLVWRQNQELGTETRDVAKTFHEVTKARFKAQAIAELEVLKSSVSLAKSEADLRTIQSQLANSGKKLKTLIGNPDLPAQKFSGTLFSKFELPSFEALKGQIVVNHPVVETAKRSKEKAEAELELAKSERWPDVAVQATGGKGSEDDTIVQFGVVVPLPIFDHSQAKVAAAEHKIRRAEFEIQAAQNSVLRDLSASYNTFTSAQNRVLIYKQDILPKAKTALAQSNTGYTQGKFSHLDVLDAQRTLAEARIAYVFALLDLNEAAADIERVTGSPLQGLE